MDLESSVRANRPTEVQYQPPLEPAQGAAAEGFEICEHGEDGEQASQEISPLRDPGNRLDPQGMDREEQRGGDGAEDQPPGAAALSDVGVLCPCEGVGRVR
jgi:hypothetical protein